MAAHAFYFDVVSVEDFRKFGCRRLKPPFKIRVTIDLLSRFDGGGLTFDVSEGGGDLGDFFANLIFHGTDSIVRFFEGELLVHFYMLFDVQSAIEILDADVMDVQVVAGGDGADAV